MNTDFTKYPPILPRHIYGRCSQMMLPSYMDAARRWCSPVIWTLLADNLCNVFSFFIFCISSTCEHLFNLYKQRMIRRTTDDLWSILILYQYTVVYCTVCWYTNEAYWFICILTNYEVLVGVCIKLTIKTILFFALKLIIAYEWVCCYTLHFLL